METSQSKTSPAPRPSRRAGVKAAAKAVAAGSLLLVAGCAGGPSATNSPASTSESKTPQGSSSDVVFSSPDIPQYPQTLPPEYLPEYGRRDAMLAVRTNESIYPLDAWPAEPRPSVFMSRRVRVSTDADSFYLFDYRLRDYRRSR